MPTHEEMSNCFESNPHGAGYMYAYNDKVHIRKGFFTLKEMEESLVYTEKEVGISFDLLSIVLHFRLATSGKINKENCHPFPNSRKQKWLKRTSIYWDIGVVHNGIAPQRCVRGELSDSQMFILKVLWKYTFQEMKVRQHDTSIFPAGFNKFAVMNKDGKVITIGDFHVDSYGRRWSNFGYQYDRNAFAAFYKNTINSSIGWDNRYYGAYA